jgi:hypothetical protein
MEREVEISELLELLKMSEGSFTGDLLHGVSLYNPSTDEEYRPIAIHGGAVHFKDLAGKSRSIPFVSISKWTAVLPEGSALNSSQLSSRTQAGLRQALQSKVNQLGLSSGQSQSSEDLQAILDAWTTPILQTQLEFRRLVYRSIKKMENEPALVPTSYKVGFAIMERWLTQPLEVCPPDYLIQLAYYRRWTKQTDAALKVTALIERRDAKEMFRDVEISVLATERAAAYMDRYEETGTGLDNALRFLKYHHKLRDGESDEHNRNAWKRYNILSADRPYEAR